MIVALPPESRLNDLVCQVSQRNSPLDFHHAVDGWVNAVQLNAQNRCLSTYIVVRGHLGAD